MAAAACEVEPSAAAVVKTAIRQHEFETRYPFTRIILESQLNMSVADELRVHQRMACIPCDFRPERSKKASHSVKPAAVARYRKTFRRRDCAPTGCKAAPTEKFMTYRAAIPYDTGWKPLALLLVAWLLWPSAQ